MPPLYTALKIPAFDLSWLTVLHEGEFEEVILIVGGGGSAKTGVPNCIQVAKRGKKFGELMFLKDYHTDSMALSISCIQDGVSFINMQLVLVGLEGGACKLLTATKNTNDENIYFSELASFQADFCEIKEESSIDCSLILKNGKIVTGGHDGVCRLWALSLDEVENKWSIHLDEELVTHKMGVSSLCVHPTESWICSGGKDGHIFIIDINENKNLWGKATSTDYIKNFKPGKFPINELECKGVCFSVNGDHLFSIQCSRRGPTYLVKWSIEKIGKPNDPDFKLKLEPIM